MALSIEEILGYVPLTKAIETVKSGVPRVLPEAFYRRNPAFRLLGDKTRRIETEGTRKSARLVPYGAPSRQIDHLPLSGRDIKLLHTEEKMQFSHELFLQIREFDSYTVQQKFAEEARRQVMNQTTRMLNLETNLVNLTLANAGKLWFNSDGEPLASSSGADLTVDPSVSANNQNQLNGIITASWATSSTPIVTHLNNIKMTARQTTGHSLKYALYGKNIMRYLMNNDQVSTYLKYTGAFSGGKAQFWLESGQIPQGLFDLEWIPMQDTFLVSEAGTLTEIWGADNITFAPDVADPNVYGIYEGSYPVPKKWDISSDVMSQFANYDHVYGKYGYGYPSLPPQPLGIFGIYGDTFMPALMNPNAYYFCDTTP